jgi:hypothetical protein
LRKPSHLKIFLALLLGMWLLTLSLKSSAEQLRSDMDEESDSEHAI